MIATVDYTADQGVEAGLTEDRADFSTLTFTVTQARTVADGTAEVTVSGPAADVKSFLERAGFNFEDLDATGAIED